MGSIGHKAWMHEIARCGLAKSRPSNLGEQDRRTLSTLGQQGEQQQAHPKKSPRREQGGAAQELGNKTKTRGSPVSIRSPATIQELYE
jgi:hypothetical protein